MGQGELETANVWYSMACIVLAYNTLTKHFKIMKISFILGDPHPHPRTPRPRSPVLYFGCNRSISHLLDSRQESGEGAEE